MSQRETSDDREIRVDDHAAARLLARAGEIDAQRGSSSLAELRQAAVEAGIAGASFDAAAAELSDESSAMPATTGEGGRHLGRRLVRAGVVALAAALALAGGVVTRAWIADARSAVALDEALGDWPPAAAAGPTVTVGVRMPRTLWDEQGSYFRTDDAKPVEQLNAIVPSYPAAVRAERPSGRTVLQFVVDPSGRADVSTIHVVRSEHDAFTAAAREAVAQMEFAPAEVRGRLVRQRVEQTFVFMAEGASGRR